MEIIAENADKNKILKNFKLQNHKFFWERRPISRFPKILIKIEIF